MPDDAFITQTLADLEAEALKILDDVAVGHRVADGATLALLDNVARQSARTAYGNNSPEFLSGTMRHLICWCDHLDEERCVNAFKAALRHRPLPAPPWSARTDNVFMLSRREHVEEAMNAKRKAVLDRIELLEQAIRKATEYLESGEHANWSGFRPLFDRKLRDGKELPPHKEWVKNVFLPSKEKALSRAEKILQRLNSDKKSMS